MRLCIIRHTIYDLKGCGLVESGIACGRFLS
nr:MAG TPA: hypothetical protein [Caudoviricetes sp.]DAW12556.1 MAG TPA: hypothetical protein [Caudoviricetes sp.]